MRRIALTLPLVAGETATSVVSRLAVRNRAGFASDFCLDVGLDWAGIIRGDGAALAELAVVAGVDRAALTRASIRTPSPGCMILGDEITNHGLVNKALPRVCPLCVLEDVAASGIAAGAGRCHWSILAIHRCHRHGAELIVLPGRANRGQGYDLSRLIGLNLGRIKAAAAVVESRPETALERYLRTRVARRGHEIWPDRLALHVVARTAQALGCRILFGPDHRPSQFNADQMRDAGQTGFEILARGP